MNNKNLTFFFINNIKIYHFKKNRNIIDYLENFNFKIPHFCYHSKLSIAGNCRMCLIELKNSPKPLISCAMILSNKMEIFTHSPLVKKARENILEFLLLNHPLDCPICDQGGECDLQDQSIIFGNSKTRFFNYKRNVLNKNLGPIVKTVMTRCIHCTKCVRFSTEIAGLPDLGIFGRGYFSEIGTYINKIFFSELSSNVIDICPVGALTNKPYSFIERNWELINIKTSDFSDSFGTNVLASIKNNFIITKFQPIFDKNNNENIWISNKTRFIFEGIFSQERLLLININNIKNLIWKNLFKKIIYLLYFQYHLLNHKYFNNKLNIIIGENISLDIFNILFLLEKKYSFIKLNTLDKINLNNEIDLNFSINSFKSNFNFDKSSLILLLGINSRYENSLLNIKLYQRYKKGNFKIFSINSLLNLLIPYTLINSNILTLKKIMEGNHLFCQEFLKAKNPLIIYNSNFFIKKSNKNFVLFYKDIIRKFHFFKKNCLINYINSSYMEVSNNYFININKFNFSNFNKSFGFFF